MIENDLSLDYSKHISKHIFPDIKPLIIKILKKQYSINFEHLKLSNKFRHNSFNIPQPFRKIDITHVSENIFNFHFQIEMNNGVLEIPLKNHIYFNSHLEKIMTIFNSIFKKTSIVYMANTTVKFKFTSLIYKIFTPRLKPFNENICVIGYYPIIKSLNNKHVMMYGNIVFNCLLGKEEVEYNKFLLDINKLLFDFETDHYILVDDSLETIKEKLTVGNLINY